MDVAAQNSEDRLDDQQGELTKERIRELALNHEYDLAGFASLGLAPADRENLERFAADGYAAGMSWFAEHLELRQNPAELFPGGESALVLGVYYRDLEMESALESASRKVSRYAGGRDYHRLLRKKGKRLLAALRELQPQLNGRIVVDSAPVPEKILGRMAGLGWQGKHTNLIHPELGSYFFLSVLLLDQEFAPDGPLPDLCGECRLCLDACPTGALFDDYRLDAGRCISYLTIERDEELPIESALASAVVTPNEDQNAGADFEGWVFGCDICQEVCPYNRNRRVRERTTREPGFRLRDSVREFMHQPHYGPNARDNSESGEYDRTSSEALLQGSPLGRAGMRKLLQNTDYVRKSRD